MGWNPSEQSEISTVLLGLSVFKSATTLQFLRALKLPLKLFVAHIKSTLKSLDFKSLVFFIKINSLE